MSIYYRGKLSPGSLLWYDPDYDRQVAIVLGRDHSYEGFCEIMLQASGERKQLNENYIPTASVIWEKREDGRKWN